MVSRCSISRKFLRVLSLGLFLCGSGISGSEEFLVISKVPRFEGPSITSAWSAYQPITKAYFAGIVALIESGDASEDLLEAWRIFVEKPTVLGPVTKELLEFRPGYPWGPSAKVLIGCKFMKELFESWRCAIEELHCTKRAAAEETVRVETPARIAAEARAGTAEAEVVRLSAQLEVKERERDDARAAATAVASGEDELFGAMEAW